MLRRCQRGGGRAGPVAVRGCRARAAPVARGSILALRARDNLENIIQNSTFQHVSSIKGGFLSRVSTKAAWPQNAQIRLKKRGKVQIFSDQSIATACVDKCVFSVRAHTAHVYPREYQLERGALLTHTCFLVLFPPVLTICVLFTVSEARSCFTANSAMFETGPPKPLAAGARPSRRWSLKELQNSCAGVSPALLSAPETWTQLCTRPVQFCTC